MQSKEKPFMVEWNKWAFWEINFRESETTLKVLFCSFRRASDPIEEEKWPEKCNCNCYKTFFLTQKKDFPFFFSFSFSSFVKWEFWENEANFASKDSCFLFLLSFEYGKWKINKLGASLFFILKPLPSNLIFIYFLLIS